MPMEFKKDKYQHMKDKNEYNSKALFGPENHDRLKDLDGKRSQEKEQARAGAEGAYVYKSAYRKRVDHDFFDMQKLTKSELARIGKTIVGQTPNQIMELVLDGEACALDVMMAAIVARIIRSGDINAFNQLMDRLVGKIETSGKGQDPGDDPQSNTLEIVIDNVRKIRLPANGRESAVG